MSMVRCPGQDSLYWKSEDLFEAPCPQCGKPIEFWKDEPRRKCRHCGNTAANPKFDLGCAKWCQYAEKCLGMIAQPTSEASICETLIAEMTYRFGQDEKRIRHARAVLKRAEEMLPEKGADPLVVKAAAILHDIGIQEAERKHGSSAGKYQEMEGPPIAREVLQKMGVDSERLEHICRIVGSHHSAKDIDTLEFNIVRDADQWVNRKE